jgi:hypothetical protein
VPNAHGFQQRPTRPATANFFAGPKVTKSMKTQVSKIAVLIVGALLVLNGLINISDNGTVLSYDITSILSGVGFILMFFRKA